MLLEKVKIDNMAIYFTTHKRIDRTRPNYFSLRNEKEKKKTLLSTVNSDSPSVTKCRRLGDKIFSPDDVRVA